LVDPVSPANPLGPVDPAGSISPADTVITPGTAGSGNPDDGGSRCSPDPAWPVGGPNPGGLVSPIRTIKLRVGARRGLTAGSGHVASLGDAAISGVMARLSGSVGADSAAAVSSGHAASPVSPATSARPSAVGSWVAGRSADSVSSITAVESAGLVDRPLPAVPAASTGTPVNRGNSPAPVDPASPVARPHRRMRPARPTARAPLTGAARPLRSVGAARPTCRTRSAWLGRTPLVQRTRAAR
jgi:hypothetical protein